MAPSTSSNAAQVMASPVRQTLNDILAGLLTGTISVLSAISLAGLIFSAELDAYLPVGIGIMLLSNFLIRIITALGSSFPIAIGNPQPEQVTILAVMAAAIGTQLTAVAMPEAILPTILAAIALGSLLTGIFLLILSPFKLDKAIRYIPFPIVGGFLAGIGFLLVEGGFKFMLREPLGKAMIILMLNPDTLLRWLPGALLAGWLMLMVRRLNRPILIPVSVLGAIALFYLTLLLLNVSVGTAESQGLLLGPFNQGGFWQTLEGVSVGQIQWSALRQQAGSLLTLMTLSALSLLLNAVGLEVITDREGNLKRELFTVGVANCLSGFTGGVAGSFSLKSSILAWRMGGRSRLVGLTAAGVFALTLLFGISVLGMIPRAIVGGVLVYLGLGLLFEWGIESRTKMPRADYFTVMLILGIIATAGLLRGISGGLVVAALVFVLRYSQVATTRRVLTGRDYRSNVERTSHQERWLRQHGEQIHILELQGFLFFGTVNNLLQLVRSRLQLIDHAPLEFIVFDFRLVTGLDASAVVIFSKLRQLAEHNELTLLFTAPSDDIWHLLEQGSAFQESRQVERFPDLDRGIEWCENRLLETASQNLLPAESSVLRLSGLFNNDSQIALFLEYLQKVNLEARQYLFNQGDYSDSLYFVASGQLNVLLEMPDGSTRRLRSFGPGAVLGEMGLYTQAPRSASILAERSSCLYKLDQAALMQMEADEPALANVLHTFVIRALSARLTHVKQDPSMLLMQPRGEQPHVVDETALADLSITLSGFIDFSNYDDTLDDELFGGLINLINSPFKSHAQAMPPTAINPVMPPTAINPANDDTNDDTVLNNPTVSADATMVNDQTMLINRCRQELANLIGPMADIIVKDVLLTDSHLDGQSLIDAIAANLPDLETSNQFRRNVE
ncbi:MAG: SulP family inorganic anion transporter [Cyanobacteria bacterium J06635_15]